MDVSLPSVASIADGGSPSGQQLTSSSFHYQYINWVLL